MKPVSRKVMSSSKWFSGDLSQNFGLKKTIAKVQGSVKKLGQAYINSNVVLYDKATLLPLAIRRPDENGNYSFLGLNTDIKTFVVAFDQKQQFNAVIQDNVVPK
ncbi:hypothetical protein [Acinetobacter sp. YH12120]|uniref:hypothetical protein n=1 Tax=Acinetobacter sp. YH12120 TaxID=2601107 RepID=UPI0015D264F5|nr:hypothetical protein [Acinetobacter sp. YH12120]